MQQQKSLSETVDEAFRGTEDVVVERARQTNTPVVLWENGRVVKIPADEFSQSLPDRSGDKSSHGLTPRTDVEPDTDLSFD